MDREIVPSRDIGVALNEWNTTFGIPRQHMMESALYGARLMNVFDRQGDLVRMSAVSDLVNGWPGGVIQASRHDVFTTATYSVIEAYNRHRGDWRLKSDVECSIEYDPGDPSPGTAVPALDVSVTTTDAGTELFLKVVNTSAEDPVRTRVELEGIEGQLGDNGTATTVTAATLKTANTFSEPNLISGRRSEFSIPGPRFEYEFPEHSVTVIRFAVSLPGSQVRA